MIPTHKVTKDGKERFRGDEHDCWIYILKHQPQSVAWACKHEGWKVEELLK